MSVSTLVEFRVSALALHSLHLMSFSRTRRYKMPLLIPQGMVVEAQQKSLFFFFISILKDSNGNPHSERENVTLRFGFLVQMQARGREPARAALYCLLLSNWVSRVPLSSPCSALGTQPYCGGQL